MATPELTRFAARTLIVIGDCILPTIGIGVLVYIRSSPAFVLRVQKGTFFAETTRHSKISFSIVQTLRECTFIIVSTVPIAAIG